MKEIKQDIRNYWLSQSKAGFTGFHCGMHKGTKQYLLDLPIQLFNGVSVTEVMYNLLGLIEPKVLPPDHRPMEQVGRQVTNTEFPISRSSNELSASTIVQSQVGWKLSKRAKPLLKPLILSSSKGGFDPVFCVPPASLNFWDLILSAQNLQCSCNIYSLWKFVRKPTQKYNISMTLHNRVAEGCISANLSFAFIAFLPFGTTVSEL